VCIEAAEQRVACGAVCGDVRRSHTEGWPEGGGAEYFPGMPEGFPHRGDFRAMQTLVRMARLLHGWPDCSRRWPGHEWRLREHTRRVREHLGRRKTAVVS
jgi:hypothetical protein